MKSSGAHLLLPSSGRPQICCMLLLSTARSQSWAGSWWGELLLSVTLGRHMLLGQLLLSVQLLGRRLTLSIRGQLLLLGRWLLLRVPLL